MGDALSPLSLLSPSVAMYMSTMSSAVIERELCYIFLSLPFLGLSAGLNDTGKAVEYLPCFGLVCVAFYGFLDGRHTEVGDELCEVITHKVVGTLIVEVCSAIDANHPIKPCYGKLAVSPVVGVDEDCTHRSNNLGSPLSFSYLLRVSSR